MQPGNESKTPSKQELQKAADRLIPSLNPDTVKFQKVIKSDNPREGTIYELWDAEYFFDGSAKTVRVKKFFGEDSPDYLGELRGLALIIPAMGDYFIKVYGKLDIVDKNVGHSRQEIVMENRGIPLNEYLESIPKEKLSDSDQLIIFRILHDVARGLQNLDNKTPENSPDVIFRDIKPTNIFVHSEKKIEDAKGSANEVYRFPPLAVVGPYGCPDTASRCKANSDNNLYLDPPESTFNNYPSYEPSANIWRFGMLAFTCWTQIPMHELGRDKQIMIQQFKPRLGHYEKSIKGEKLLVEDKEWNGLYQTRWKAQPGDGGAPALLWWITIECCLQPQKKKRPSSNIVAEVMLWLIKEHKAKVAVCENENEVIDALVAGENLIRQTIEKNPDKFAAEAKEAKHLYCNINDLIAHHFANFAALEWFRYFDKLGKKDAAIMFAPSFPDLKLEGCYDLKPILTKDKPLRPVYFPVPIISQPLPNLTAQPKTADLTNTIQGAAQKTPPDKGLKLKP